MLNIIEYIINNKKIIKDDQVIFQGYKITGIGEKTLKLTHIKTDTNNFIKWEDFSANNNNQTVVQEIKEYYQQKVDKENEKEIQKAVKFVEEDKERLDCLLKAANNDKDYKNSPAFEDLMTQEICNYAGISKLGRLVAAKITETKITKKEKEEKEKNNFSSKSSSTKKENNTKNISKINKKQRIQIENKLSEIIEKDVKIVLEQFERTRKPDHHIELDNIEFDIYDVDSCVVFAYPVNIEFFELEEKFKLNQRCIETLQLIKKLGREDNLHQFERDELDKEGYIQFNFNKFKYILTEKGEEALANTSSSSKTEKEEVVKMKENIYNTIVRYNTENGQIKKGDKIYSTTSTLDFDSITGNFEKCNAISEIKVKEISSNFTDYKAEKSFTGGNYGFYELEILEVLE